MAARQEPVWLNRLMGNPTLLLGLVLAIAATPVVLSTLAWGKYGAMISLPLMVAFITGVFFGQATERKRTGILAGMASGIVTAGLFALVLLIFGAS